jgi:UDP-N-acetylmuramate: L-alanyl-gamma-D-glutamyl-meso-diaminopimelate ligase
MRIHLIAIGGAIMHQIAITSARKGHHVTGSDDVIQEPSRSRLLEAGILPEKEGFFAENITQDIDMVILGMHAKFDNPELARAMELGIKVLSFPEYIYENSRNKKRAVIAGSHGKTSITSMVMHCLKEQNMDFDYLVGSSVAGFDYSVRLSDAPIIVIEGDEYLASPINKEPKFIYYHAHIATISGIEWDHINVFKTEEIYNAQFAKLVQSMEAGSKLFYYEDEKVERIVSGLREDVECKSYKAIDYEVLDEVFYAIIEDKKISLNVIGRHNMENIQAAKHVCLELGMVEENFWKAISSFSGAGRRLEKIVDEKQRIVFKDFAHSPSKLRATIKGVKENYPNKNLIACFEMHTYSTLTEEFLPQYKDSMNEADTAIVYIDKKVLEKKGNLLFSEEMIRQHFNRGDIHFFTELERLEEFLEKTEGNECVYLMMSSGTFGGLDLKTIAKKREVKLTEATTPTLSQAKRNALPRIDRLELTDEERNSALPIFALSFIFLIFPIAWLFIQKKNSASLVFYNLMVEFLNFQILSVLVFIVLWYLNHATFFPLYWLPWIFHIHYTSQAIRRISYQAKMELPQGLAVILSKVDKS